MADATLSLLARAALAGMLFTHSAAAATLTIVVSEVAEAEGSVMVAVVAGKPGFQEQIPPAAALVQPAQAGEMIFTASDLPPGEYAVKVMHDVNGNGKLDTNFIGLPVEPWAMSNNARGKFGPPRWKAAKFSIDGDTTHTLTLSK